MKSLVVCPEEFSSIIDNLLIGEKKIIYTNDNGDFNSIEVILANIIDIDFDYFIIFAEQTIGSYDYGGVELVKHIRLTSQLEEKQLLPIVLLHWLPMEHFINQSLENMLLFSPAIYTQRLPNVNINFETLSPLNPDYDLTQFLFNAEEDKKNSDHSFRNDIAIKQFEQELDDVAFSDLILHTLYQKKIAYRNLFNKNKFINNSNLHVSFDQPIKVLLIDDRAKEWGKVIKKAFSNCDLFECKDKVELDNLLSSFDFYSNSLIDDITDANSFINEIKNQSLTVILLDVHFDESSTKSSLKETGGFEIIKFLKNNKIYYPVIIFSATHKNLEPFFEEYDFICGQFIKSFTTLDEFRAMVQKSHKIQCFTNIVNQISLILKNEIKYYKYVNEKESGLLEEGMCIKINLVLKSLIDKCLLISKILIKSDFEENLVNSYLEEAIALLGIVQEKYSNKSEFENEESDIGYDETQKEIKGIRNGVYHLKANYYIKNYRRLSFVDKLNQLEFYFNRTIQGLIFGK